jgi:hypothetical protein
MANIVLKNTKNQPSVPQTVLIVLMCVETMKLPLPILVLNPKLNASLTDTTEIVRLLQRDDNTLDEIVMER